MLGSRVGSLVRVGSVGDGDAGTTSESGAGAVDRRAASDECAPVGDGGVRSPGDDLAGGGDDDAGLVGADADAGAVGAAASGAAASSDADAAGEAGARCDSGSLAVPSDFMMGVRYGVMRSSAVSAWAWLGGGEWSW